MQVFEKVHVWWGYQRMHANATHLTIDAVTNRDGSVFDSITLSKPADWAVQWHSQPDHPQPRPSMVRTVCFLCIAPCLQLARCAACVLLVPPLPVVQHPAARCAP
jgi:hypothetical protein